MLSREHALMSSILEDLVSRREHWRCLEERRWTSAEPTPGSPRDLFQSTGTASGRERFIRNAGNLLMLPRRLLLLTPAAEISWPPKHLTEQLSHDVLGGDAAGTIRPPGDCQTLAVVPPGIPRKKVLVPPCCFDGLNGGKTDPPL